MDLSKKCSEIRGGGLWISMVGELGMEGLGERGFMAWVVKLFKRRVRACIIRRARELERGCGRCWTECLRDRVSVKRL